jgi:MoaA/NifB/PqqE/SkfB family radical SAM enzyme
MCPRRFTIVEANTGYMTFKLWKKIIDEIANKNIILVPFWRGESLMHPMVSTMMEYARGKFKEIQFATNGILVEKHLDLLLSFDFVSISYHTDAAKKAIKLLHKHRKHKKPKLQISVVKGETTEKYINQLEKYTDIIRIYEQHSVTQLGSIGGRFGRRLCPKLFTDIVIDYTGNVSRCCHAWITNDTMNVRDSTIEEIWNGELYSLIRQNYPDHICSGCDQWGRNTVGETKLT